MCSGVVGGRAVQSCGVGGVGGVGGVRCALELCAWTGAAAMETEYCAGMYSGEWVLCVSFSYRTHTFGEHANQSYKIQAGFKGIGCYFPPSIVMRISTTIVTITMRITMRITASVPTASALAATYTTKHYIVKA